MNSMDSFSSNQQTTNANPSNGLIYAGFWPRFAAILLDALIIIIPSLIFNMIIPILGGLIISLLYKPFFESSALQATPGKALMGLSVVNLQGGRITLKQSFIRYASTLLSSALFMVGYIMAAFTEKNQALHDMIADTLVIRKTPPNINYLEAWINEVQAAFGFSSSATTSSSANSNPSSSNPIHKIEELHELFTKGLLTEEEYRLKKEELLKRI